jgi:pimeloyl-ACP methyl ester carboxylesterase
MKDEAGRTVQLEDGRRLGYAEWGDPSGQPLFYFHGWPGSLVEGRLADQSAKARRVRLIALDRPGMGLSDFQARRTLIDWPADVVRRRRPSAWTVSLSWASPVAAPTQPRAPGNYPNGSLV